MDTMHTAQADTTLDLDPAARLAAVAIPHDDRCPGCTPDDDDTDELCPHHFEQRWPLGMAA